MVSSVRQMNWGVTCVNDIGTIERIIINIILIIGRVFIVAPNIYFWILHIFLCWASYGVAKRNRRSGRATIKLPFGIKQLLFLGAPNLFTKRHIKNQIVIIFLSIVMVIVFLVNNPDIKELFFGFYFIMYFVLYLKIAKSY